MLAGAPRTPICLSDQVEALRDDPEALLLALPKAGDLHNQLYGALRAETMIAWGAADGACIDETSLTASPSCAPGATPLSEVEPGSQLYADIVAAWSLRG